jgi:hypothetical protein
VGFTVLERYRDATDEWALLRWDWSSPGRSVLGRGRPA